MYLVTGGTGLVGAHVLIRLTEKEAVVKAICRDRTQLNQVEKIFTSYGTSTKANFQKIEWLEADVTNIESLIQCLDQVHTIIHCAALVSFKKKDLDVLMKTNVEGTRNVVNAALEAKVPNLVHISSTAAIGNNKSHQNRTEDLPWKKENNTSNYSVSKHLAELEIYRGLEEGLNVLILNPGIIIGPGKWDASSAELFTKVFKGLAFYTKGTNGFVDVRDVARAAVEIPPGANEKHRYLLVAENWSYEQLFKTIAKYLNKKAPSFEVPAWALALAWRLEKVRSLLLFKAPLITKETAQSSMKKTSYDASKIKAEYHFEFIPIENAIKDCAAHFLKEFAQ